MMIIGNYELQEEIGVGGMGTVYKAHDTRSGEPVAVKQLKSDLVKPDMIERFQREGQALRDLDHPNIVKLLQTLEHEGQHYLVMEYVSGQDLTNLLRQDEEIPIERILRLAIDLADALTRAHKLNIIHRDLKPANVLIGDDGILRLTDFGVAHFGDRERVTDTNAIIGTADYLPPETFDGAAFDARGDIWAFGVILFEMLTGQQPFSGETILQVIQSITKDHVPDLDALRPDTPPALIDLVYRMLEKDPQQRIPSIRIVGAELEAILHGSSDNLSQRPAATMPQRGRFDSTPTPTRSTPNNLPSATTPFVGRTSELAELTRLLHHPDARLITVLGPGGMGKTRLSIKAAEQNTDRFPDGVYFVDLAPLSDPQQVLPAVADTIGFQFSGNPVPPHKQLADYLHARTMLIIADNFEHVIEAASTLVDILAGTPNIKILVTSRIKLNFSGEYVFTLGGMDFPEWETPEDALQHSAVKLFMQTARRAQPGFELRAEDLDYVARICRLVQGLPLGILLAGGWFGSLSIREIAAELEGSIDILDSDLRDLPERQRSVGAVLDYSLRLLPDDLKLTFHRLSIFKGGFTREAASQVAGASIRKLNTLLNHSLIQRDIRTGRYSLHELPRRHAANELRKLELFEDTAQAHAEYYASKLDRQSEHVNSLRFVHWGTQELSNIRAAWYWLVDHGQLDLLTLMIFPIHGYGMQTARVHFRNELIHYAEEKLGVEIEEAQHQFQRYLFLFNIMDFTPEGIKRSYDRLLRGLPIMEEHDKEFTIWIKFVTAVLEATFFGKVDSVIDKLMDALSYYDQGLPPSLKVPPKGDMLRWISLIYAIMGNFDQALDYALEAAVQISAVDIVHALDARLYIVYLRMAEGGVTGDYQAAMDEIALIINHESSLHTESRKVIAQAYQAMIELVHEDIQQAKDIAQKLGVYAQRENDANALKRSKQLEAEIALCEGRYNDAHQTITKTQWMMTGIDHFHDEFHGMSLLNLIQEEYTSAKQNIANFIYGDLEQRIPPCIMASAHYVEKFGEAAYYGQALLHILAAIQAGQGNVTQAAELLGKISVRPYQNHHWAEDLAVFTDLPQKLVATLGETAFNQAFDRGKSLDLLSAVPQILGRTQTE